VQAFAIPPAWKKTFSYHPSGRWLLSLSNTGQCELLQVADGKRLAIPMEGQITAATFSPDGTRLVVAAEQEVAVFKCVHPTASPDRPGVVAPATFDTTEVDRWTGEDSVNCLQFSADGELLLLGGNLTVQVRDVPKRSFRTGSFDLGSQVTSAAISSDNRRFAVRCEDKQVRVFSSAQDQASFEPLLPALPSDSQGILMPMFVGTNRVVVIDDYQSVRCWKIDEQEIVWEYKPKRVLTAAMSPDGKWIALGEDGELVLLDSETGTTAESPIKHPNLINNISFHPTKSLLLTASVDHKARMFEFPSGKPVGLTIPHSDAVHRCTWSPDGATFATVHWAGDLVRIWRPSDPQLQEFVAATSAHGPFVRLNDRGDRWLSSGFDGGRVRTEIEVFDVQTGQAIGPKFHGPGLISDADFVPKSPVIVVAGGGKPEDLYRALPDQRLETPGFIRLLNSETGEPMFPDVTTPSQPIAVRSSPNGQTVVVLCHQGHLLLLDAATGKLRAEHQAFDDQPAVHGFLIRERIRFSERGDQFVIWGCNALAELRKSDTGERLAKFSHNDGSFIHDAQFSPDGKLVATCSSDHSVRLWDTATGLSDGPPLAHSGWVFSAQFTRDGRRLLTASEDKQARIWDLKSRTAVLATREHGDQVFSVLFLPGEEVFLASTRDGQITAWDASLGKMIAPARTMPGMVYQLSRRGSSSQVIASGQINPMRGFDWTQWILDPDTKLSRADVRLLGELLSSQRIHESGAATSLTSAEWIERWNKLRERHPDHGALTVSFGAR
jgi:WD40 repeat protein